MKYSKSIDRSVAATVGMVFLGAVLASCGQTASGDGALEPPERAGTLAKQAEPYVGDPWEQRFRKAFWSEQHIHDSWNRCHLGENVSDALRNAPGC
jgi:hypothetical protein